MPRSYHMYALGLHANIALPVSLLLDADLLNGQEPFPVAYKSRR